MNKIGIFGGAFNPPHIGHIELANHSIKFLELDKLLIIPTKIAPHKKIEDLFGLELRLLLSEIAFYSIDPGSLALKLKKIFKNINFNNFIKFYEKFYNDFHNPKIYVSDIEMNDNKNIKSYSYYTILELKKIYKSSEFFIIIGMDQALILHTWYNIKILMEMETITFCIAERNNISFKYLCKFLEDKLGKLPKIIDLKFNEINISSTAIRKDLKNHLLSNKLPEILKLFFFTIFSK